MRYLRRELESQALKAARSFPAVVLTGPRRAGKTVLLRHLFPAASYYLFEDPDVVARFRHDPQGFLDGVRLPAILDEIQNVPEVFNFVRARIDRQPRRVGRWFLTGSQEAGLMRHVTESMAGRAAVLQLLPLSVRETPKVSLLRGGYPEVLARPAAVTLWFSSYLQTYLERDVRSISVVQEPATFRRFLALVASRHGQVLNKSDLAAPLGMSVPGIGRWLDILEATAQVLIVPPYFENVGKRLIKSPKIYIADSGLACHLLGIETEAELEKSPFLGALFEGFIAGEIVKAQLNAGRRRELYYFRDQQGLEVDFVMPGKGGALRLVEAKAARTVTPRDAGPMQRLAAAWSKRPGGRGRVEQMLVHRPARAGVASRAVAPGSGSGALAGIRCARSRMSANTEQSNFPKGSRLGPYEIASSIGAGGMGEVFRARDTRLNRDVAVKVLPKDFVADADRLRRFEQEAKTLAALNHPNVLTVFDAGAR